MLAGVRPQISNEVVALEPWPRRLWFSGVASFGFRYDLACAIDWVSIGLAGAAALPRGDVLHQLEVRDQGGGPRPAVSWLELPDLAEFEGRNVVLRQPYVRRDAFRDVNR